MFRLLFPIHNIVSNLFTNINLTPKKYASLSTKAMANKKRTLKYRINKLEKMRVDQDDIKMIMKMLFEQQHTIKQIQAKLDYIDTTNQALTETLDYFIDDTK